jgi:uncharacterized membrane-anchored protein
MKIQHNPIINFRYWVLISLASVFGTNTGDLAVKLTRISGIFPPQGLFGIKHCGPLPILILLFVVLWILEKRDKEKTELFFWSAILIIRTAATNIADIMTDDVNFDYSSTTAMISISLTGLALYWQKQREKPINPVFVPETTNLYWLMMLLAGVLGTSVGDYVAHEYGLGPSSLVLGTAMVVLVMVGFKNFLIFTPLYWFGITFARIAGTDVGDWLAKSAERGGAGLDLSTATVISGFVFVIAALFWKSSASQNSAP